MKNILLLLLFSVTYSSLVAQSHGHHHGHTFTEADTLRGALRPERTAYDVTFYDLNIQLDIDEKFIHGYVDVHYDAVNTFERLQIDLFENMKLLRVEFEDKNLDFSRLHHAVFIDFPKQKKGSSGRFRLHYEGHPIVARQAPWDGGFVFDQHEGKPWVGVACEGTGASLWWPNKDHLSDEPDSMSIRVAVAPGLMVASNGNLRDTTLLSNGYTRYDWFVSYPINNYNVSITVADFAHFSDVYVAADGDSLALDYYVLPENLEKARRQFQQVPKMLACYETYLGKYPFWEDGFAMIETPYLGMEHQSGIAYGNHYMRGYLGGMIPADMDWDYIIIHETGHEYFGNAVSVNDHAEMWIHESFTTYLESIYVECVYGYQDAMRYLRYQRGLVANKEPILGPLEVNFKDFRSSDYYFKGALMLNNLRHAINDDELWFDCLRSFYQRYQIGHAVTQDFVDYVQHCTQRDYSHFFEQYLQHPDLPIFEYEITKISPTRTQLRYRWQADVNDFDMPLLVGDSAAYERIFPTNKWQTQVLNVAISDFEVADELFYIESKEQNK